MKCSNCGAELRNGAKFCAGCGKEVKEEPLVMYCGKCGNQLQGGAKFCANCGEPVTDQGASVTNQGEPVTNQSASVTNQGEPVTNQSASVTNQGEPVKIKGTSVRKDSSSNKKLIIGGIGVAVVVVLILFFRLVDVHRMFLKDYEKPFYDYCKLVNERCKDNYKYWEVLSGGDQELAERRDQAYRFRSPRIKLFPEYVKDLEDVYGKRYKMKYRVFCVEEGELSEEEIDLLESYGIELASETYYEVVVEIKIEGTHDSGWHEFSNGKSLYPLSDPWRVRVLKLKDGYYTEADTKYAFDQWMNE